MQMEGDVLCKRVTSHTLRLKKYSIKSEYTYIPSSPSVGSPLALLTKITVWGRALWLLPTTEDRLCKLYCRCTVMSHWEHNMCFGSQSVQLMNASLRWDSWQKPYGTLPASSMASRSWGLAFRHLSPDNAWRTLHVWDEEDEASGNILPNCIEHVLQLLYMKVLGN